MERWPHLSSNDQQTQQSAYKHPHPDPEHLQVGPPVHCKNGLGGASAAAMYDGGQIVLFNNCRRWYSPERIHKTRGYVMRFSLFLTLNVSKVVNQVHS